MSLRTALVDLRSRRAIDLLWGERKFAAHYHRYTRDPDVGRAYGETCLEVAERLEAGTRGPLGEAAAEEAARLMVDICTGRAGPKEVRERSGHAMSLPLVLHRLTGGHRERYLGHVAELPPCNDYQPTYITMGPTGKCNVVCPDCIIGGAIFQKDRQRLHRWEDVEATVAALGDAGIRRVSFCIGEPTYNVPLLYRTFDALRESGAVEARSLVTNALFARRYEKAVAFVAGFRDHLGPDLARRCVLGISLNDDLVQVGVPIEATANLIQAAGEVLGPDHRVVVQLIMDAGFHRVQNALFGELGRRGLLADPDAWRLDAEGFHESLPLTSGANLRISVMRKQPSLHNPFARDAEGANDAWVRYFTEEALTGYPLKGLYTYDGGEDPDGHDDLVVHRITLGPDGILYPDYHFMVAGARPLGATLPDAIDSFRRDPLLGVLLRRGGLNMLLATYMAIPAEQRLLDDVLRPATLGSTTGMVAANVLFGDDEVADQLLLQVLRHGLSAPAGDPT